MEHIQIALSLLGKRDLRLADNLGHLDLLRMMRSHIQFELPGKKELTMAIVHDESPLVGKTVNSLYRQLKDYEFEIIAILRREHMLLPHPDTLVETNDRMMMIASPHALDPLAQFVTLLPEAEDSGVHISAAGAHP